MNRNIAGICICMLVATTIFPISINLVDGKLKNEMNMSLGASIWYQTFGGDGNDGFYVVQQAHDSGYIAAGFTNSIGQGSYDAWLVKTNADGAKEWEKTFGGSGDDRFSFMQRIPDGYILVGQNNEDLWVVKIDQNGNIIWDRTFGGSKSDKGWGIAHTADGYIISGQTESFTPYDTYRMWLIKTDENGIEQWNHTYGNEEEFSEGKKVFQTKDGSYLLIGSNWLLNEWSHIFIVKTDKNGVVEWEKNAAVDLGSISVSLEETQDGKFLISGATGESFKGCKALIIILDSDGTIVMEKQYGRGIFLDSFWYAIPTDDGGYICTGSRLGLLASINIGLPWFPYWSKMSVVKLDGAGNIVWSGSPQGNGQARCIQKTSDGAYIVGGYTENYPNFGDGVLFKVDSNGNFP